MIHCTTRDGCAPKRAPGLRLLVLAMSAGVMLFAGGSTCQMPGEMAGATPDTPSGGPVSFAAQIQPIFDANCIVCHQMGGIADLEGIALRLTTQESFNGLVNQSSSQQPDFTLVVPGDAESSLMFQKVSSDTPPVGSRMPLFRAPLSATDIGLIRDWIDEGAQKN